MRFNKQELITLAMQPANKFDKEGLLFITEKQEGFFRKQEGRHIFLFGIGGGTSSSSSCSSSAATAVRRSNSLTTSSSASTSIASSRIAIETGTDGGGGGGGGLAGKRNSCRRKSLNCIGGNFGKKVNAERWCRLRGNLLFYFKTDDQFSDLQGVIVLEKCKIVETDNTETGTRYQSAADGATTSGGGRFGFVLEFEDGLRQRLATSTEQERNVWIQAITMASYSEMRRKLQRLTEKLDMRRGPVQDIDMGMVRLQTGLRLDIDEVPICETALSCDNLLCDGHGRPPSPSVLIQVANRLANGPAWTKYGCTEVIAKSSNPQFVTTVLFRNGDGLTGASLIRFTVYDVREQMSHTAVAIGSAQVSLDAIKDTSRLRLPLQSPATTTTASNNNVGFITINSWSPVREKKLSTRSPSKAADHQVQMVHALGHRRSQSLPPKLGVKLYVPQHQRLSLLFVNPHVRSYRLQSGLGGEISVHELMLESPLCFRMPQHLLSIWILREKELLQEISGMGELGGEWRNKQMELLDKHLKLLKNYSQAKQNLMQYNSAGNTTFFKPSARKGDEALEFAPVNMHLQRMCAHNETLKRSGVLDVVTVGAFTRHNGKTKTGGLIKLLQQVKARHASGSLAAEEVACKVAAANDAVQAIKQLRREIVEIMSQLLLLAKTKNPKGMLPLCTEMVAKTRSLLMIWEPSLVDEAFAFIERHRIVEEATAQPRRASDLSSLSPFKKITEQLCALDLKSPDLEDFATPLGPAPDLWPRHAQAASAGSMTDLKALTTVQDTVRNYHERNRAATTTADEGPNAVNRETQETHFDVNGEVSSDQHQARTMSQDSANSNDDETYLGGATTAGGFLDTKTMNSSASANYYRPTEEPEPLDLTQLNIEASVMCLVSKVKFLCGRCGSPAIRLRQPNTTGGAVRGIAAFSTPDVVTSQAASVLASEVVVAAAHDPNGPLQKPRDLNLVPISCADVGGASSGSRTAIKKAGNKFTDGLDLSMTTDWTSELRPSMRKLRQAMDGLLKTARLMHSVQRLQQDSKQMAITLSVMYRRDICFSQALTALVTGLMAKLWGTNVDINYIHLLYNLGPLAYFEGLLSLYGAETDMWGDMCVAIEDLSAVTFKLCRNTVAVPTTTPTAANSINSAAAVPTPKIVGSRQALTVLLPVPDAVHQLLPTKEAIVFKVTPVFFNIGINEKATISETLRYTTEQNRSNWDNYDRLRQYHMRYRKLIFIQPDTPTRGGGGGPPTSGSTEHVLDLLASMEEQLKANVSKNVRVLQLAEDIARAISGIAFISCKSAKDRTAMAVTLQQCRILQSEFHLPASNMQSVLNTMRSEGTRSENTLKNIGLKKYAFNLPQVLSLPQQYRPPTGSYGKAQS